MQLFNRALRVLLLTNGFILVAGAMLGPIYALFVEEVGGDLLAASFTVGVFALAAGVTTLFAGHIADKVRHEENVIAFGYAAMGVGFLSFLFVQDIWGLLVAQAIIGFGEAIYSPAFDSLYSKNLENQKEGIEWGAWESLNYFTVALGAIVGGVLASAYGFQSIFIVMSALCLGSAAYLKLTKKLS